MKLFIKLIITTAVIAVGFLAAGTAKAVAYEYSYVGQSPSIKKRGAE